MSVTCFKKVADEFKQKARENRFVVRDFAYDEEQLKSGEGVAWMTVVIFMFDIMQERMSWPSCTRIKRNSLVPWYVGWKLTLGSASLHGFTWRWLNLIILETNLKRVPCSRRWEYLLNQCWGLVSQSTSRGWFWTHSENKSRNWGKPWMTSTCISTLLLVLGVERKSQVNDYNHQLKNNKNSWISGLAGFGQGEYYPYVYYKINIDMVGPVSSLNN